MHIEENLEWQIYSEITRKLGMYVNRVRGSKTIIKSRTIDHVCPKWPASAIYLLTWVTKSG